MSTVERLKGTRALVIGDVMLDEYVWGNVSRISPEAPVPVVEVRRRTYVPGGAANAAVGIAALGATVLLGGVVGDDAAAERVRATLAERGIDAVGLVTVEGRSTTTKTRVIAHNQQVVRTDVEEREALPADATRALEDWVGSQLDAVDVVLISDYAKGVVSVELAQSVIERSAERGKPLVVDPKGSDYARYRGATVLTPNVADVKRAANIAPDSFVELEDVAKKLAEVIPGSALLITRGAQGMTLLSDSSAVEIPATAKDVYDVTGAGDTVVAVLAAGLGAGLDLEEAVRLANTAAAIVVGKVGTATVTLEELGAAVGAAQPPE